MRTKIFWTDAAERAVKSAAQALVLLWGADTFSLIGVDYLSAAGLAGGAAVLSLLTSIASSRIGSTSSASAIR